MDGLIAIDDGERGSVLAGLRYTDNASHQKNPFNLVNNPISAPTGTTDFTAYSVFPIFGYQVAYEGSWGRLGVYALGASVAWGSVKTARTNGGIERLEQNGSFNKGYLMEVFADYSKRFGSGQMGIFGR
ncbi:MAG: hypothetical protein ACLP5H_00615 [Desulfomonilaceae bacterium]